MRNKLCFYMAPLPSIKSYYDMLDMSAEYGFDKIEGFCMLDFSEPDIEAAKKIRKYADSLGIGFSCFSVYINLVGDDREEQLSRILRYADVAKELGSPHLHHTIAADFLNRDEVLGNRELYFERGIETVRTVYDYCESIGIKAIYEEQGFVFNGVDGYARFLDTVGRDVGVVCDFANICQSGERIAGFIKRFGKRIVHVHIKDAIFSDVQSDTAYPIIGGGFMQETEIGKGDIDIEGAIKLLSEFGYNGYFGIEYQSPDNKKERIDNAVSYINSIFKSV